VGEIDTGDLLDDDDFVGGDLKDPEDHEEKVRFGFFARSELNFPAEFYAAPNSTGTHATSSDGTRALPRTRPSR